MGLTRPRPELASALKYYLPDHHLGWAIVGSATRAEQELADVDYWIFVEKEPTAPRDHYRLVWQPPIGLLSLSQKTFASARSAFENPQDAIFAVPAAQSMVIAEDPSGQIALLKTIANDFTWSSIKEKADEAARESLMGLAEELMKVRKGLRTNNRETALRAATGLTLTCPWITLLATGTLIESENNLVGAAKSQMSTHWADYHDQAAGWNPEVPQSWRQKAIAAAHLYRLTVDHFADLLDLEAKETVQEALWAIKSEL